MLVGISIEEIEYVDPPRVDTQRPFEPLSPGDHVLVRVRALHLGEPPLARGQAQIGVLVPQDAEVAVAGRRGVRGCERVERAFVYCPITIKLRDEEEASVLLRITIPEGLPRSTLRVVGNVRPAPGSRPKSVKVPLATPSPTPPQPPPPTPPAVTASWTGVWSWHAVWSTGSFDGAGMTIAHEGSTVCARWPWSPPDGHAKGTVSGSTWTADWTDGFGNGTWTLTLTADGSSFTGTQQVTPHPGNGAPFTAQISGTRTSAGAGTLDCDAVPAP